MQRPNRHLNLDPNNKSNAKDMSMSVIPGLGGDEPDDADLRGHAGSAGVGVARDGSGGVVQSQVVELKRETEWRFEVSVARLIEVTITQGTAELFGTELVLNKTYTFLGVKAAIFTWTGCAIEISREAGALASEYVAEETTMNEAMNVHLALEAMRNNANASTGLEGPRVLILGPENSGKTTLAKILTGFAIRSSRAPIVVGLDPKEGTLSLPGTVTATVFKTLMEVESDAGGGWGTSPMSGPNGEIPVKLPLVYYFGGVDVGERDKKGERLYTRLCGQLALAVQGRMKATGQEDSEKSGIIVDTPGSLLSGEQAAKGYELVAHIVSEFRINAVICLGSERVYNDMVRKFDKQPISGTRGSATAETISVVRIPKSGGVVDRDASYMKAVAEAQIKTYFYGNPKVGANITLQPRQQQVEFGALPGVWRRITSNSQAYGTNSGAGYEDEFLPGDADEEEYAPPETTSGVPLPENQFYEKLATPTKAMSHCVLAVLNCVPDPDDQEVLKDSTCMGFLYVTDVDVDKGRISLLSPVAGRVPNRALIWGEAMEPVLDVVG